MDWLTGIDNLAQVAIVILGGSAIWLLGRREDWKRWGYVLGMLSQPFWFWATLRTEQWGLFVLSIWYTFSWGQGIWNYWIKAPALEEPPQDKSAS